MVQVLPGFGDVLAPLAEEFGKNLEKFLAPNLEFQKAMQKAVGSNPALAQQLADLEYNAPGSLRQMGFGELGDVIAQIPESPEQAAFRKKRGLVQDTLEKKIELEGANTGVSLDRINNVMKYLQENKGSAVLTDDILRTLTGQTQGQRDITEAGATVAKAEVPVKVGQARLAYDQLVKQQPGLGNTDFLKLARDFLSGDADGKTISDIMSGNTPGADIAFRAALQSVAEERQIALREKLASQHEASVERRIGEREDKREQLLLTGKAYDAYRQSRFKGTLDAWKASLSDPQKMVDVRKKIESGTLEQDLTQEERDLLEVDRAQTRMQSEQDLRNARDINEVIRKATNDVAVAQHRGEPESAIQTYIANLNNALAQKRELTGQHITAKFGDAPRVGEKNTTFWGRNPTQLYYVNDQGVRIDDSEVFAEPKIGVGGLSLAGRRAYMEIEGSPDKQAALANLKAANAALYNEVAPLFGAKSK